MVSPVVFALSIVVTALSASASSAPTHRLLSTRTFDNSTIASSCQSLCTDVLPIYEACDGGSNTSSCLEFCDQDTYTGGVNCIQCNVDAGVVDDSDLTSIKEQISNLQSTCGALGETVTGSISAANATSTSNSTSASTAATTTTSSAASTASASTTSSSSSDSGGSIVHGEGLLVTMVAAIVVGTTMFL